MVKGISALFEYETPKVVQISNLKIGVTQRLIQLIILVYVICWVMIREKGYQETDTASTVVTTKVKGVGFTNFSNIVGIGVRSWDVADYIVPPLEDNALFVITNIVKTARQTLSRCAENPSVPGAVCKSNSDCNPNVVSHLGNGLHTGNCLMIDGNNAGICEIYSWCPLENDTLPLGKNDYLFPMVYNYTILIKNDVTFEKFGVHRRNIQDWASKRYLRSCLYDKNHPENKFCPIFKFATIFNEAGVDKSMFVTGGVIGINIEWKCDLDWDVKYCNPEYKFHRLDDAHAKIATGFNFRYANFYRENGTEYRDLIKAFGIRFVIHATGEAGKFHILPLTMNIGSGLALLGLAPTVCDIIALNIIGSRHIYQRAKFETVAEEQNVLTKRKGNKTRKENKIQKTKANKNVEKSKNDKNTDDHTVTTTNTNTTNTGNISNDNDHMMIINEQITDDVVLNL